MFRVALISTGGTIEKTYDERAGALTNRVSVLDAILGSLELRGVSIDRIALMNKDSLDMTPADHALVAERVERELASHDGVVVVHGTDRLAVSGEAIRARVCASGVRKPVVLTGAMRPWELRRSDAVQNLTEALIAVQVVQPGVYVAMHNQVLAFPGVRKDSAEGTFVRDDAHTAHADLHPTAPPAPTGAL
jgi:L-asparaginase